MSADNIVTEDKKEEGEIRIPAVLASPYHAERKADGEPCVVVLRAINEETKQVIIAYGLINDSDATHVSYLEEEKFHNLYKVKGPVTYDYTINEDSIGETTSTAGGLSIVADETIPQANPVKTPTCSCN